MRRRNNTCEVAVIGAGPYDLSLAAHLKAAEIETMVFGEAMAFWRRNMPEGMKLRSPWRATHMADPGGSLSLDVYDSSGRFPRTSPLPLEEFVAYGRWFAQRAVPNLDTRKVACVEAPSRGFRLSLDDGEVVGARHVVIAAGLANQEFRPVEFRGLPAEVVSHTCEHDNFRQFRGKQVAVIGRGQSACESAVLLKEAGAEVEVVCRGPIHWLGVPSADEQTQLRWRLRELLTAPSAIGPFPFNWAAELPGLARHLPLESRKWFSDRALRAGAARWLLPRFDGIRINTGRTIAGTRLQSGRVQLQLDEGTSNCDHLLLATGYRIDLSKIGVLAPGLLEQIARIDGSPRLSRGFESNVAGLHFIGARAVASFGPMMRFIAGSGYAARTVTRAVFADRTRAARQQPVEKGKLQAAEKIFAK
jgi:cation diffusion facilitator CzcD-associated flavoprotein CzcO